MLRKHIVLIAALLLVLAGCAKRNPAWQDQDVLTLLKQVQVVGNPVDLSCEEDLIFVAQDQGGMSIIDSGNYSQRWWTEVYPPSADAMLVNIRNISAVGEHKLVFLGEYVSSDKIRIIDYSDPDSLKLVESITGGTDGLQSIAFSAIPNPTDANIIQGFFGAGRNLMSARYYFFFYVCFTYDF